MRFFAVCFCWFVVLAFVLVMLLGFLPVCELVRMVS
jgi:hypothetical protein